MKYIPLLIVPFALLSGCATEDYGKYTQAQATIEAAKHNAEAARYNALSSIANNGTDSARIAAVMAIALDKPSGNAGNGLQAPSPNQALQWASILVPGITNLAGMRYNYLSTQTQSNNAAAVSLSTNNAFLGMASKIQAPAANVSTITTSTANPVTTTNDNHAVDSHNPISYALSGTGTLGSGSYSTSANPTTTNNANPTTTLSGTGTLGSGSYNTAANPTTTTSTLSGTGTQGSGAYTTAVTSPIITPVVITPVTITPVTTTTPIVLSPVPVTTVP